jgi:hypothetical protein
VDQFIHRLLVEEDANNSPESNDELFHASADAGEKLYRKGDYAKSQISNLDVYLLKKVQKGSPKFVIDHCDEYGTYTFCRVDLFPDLKSGQQFFFIRNGSFSGWFISRCLRA